MFDFIFFQSLPPSLHLFPLVSFDFMFNLVMPSIYSIALMLQFLHLLQEEYSRALGDTYLDLFTILLLNKKFNFLPQPVRS